MSCEICGNKPMNCDCSREAKELYYLRQELEEQRQQTKANIINSSGLERRELFKAVAIGTIRCLNGDYFVWDVADAKRITEDILAAVDEFEKEQYEKAKE